MTVFHVPEGLPYLLVSPSRFWLPINLIYMYRGHHAVICISFTRQGFPSAFINIKYGYIHLEQIDECVFLKNIE